MIGRQRLLPEPFRLGGNVAPPGQAELALDPGRAQPGIVAIDRPDPKIVGESDHPVGAAGLEQRVPEVLRARSRKGNVKYRLGHRRSSNGSLTIFQNPASAASRDVTKRK